MHPTTRRRSPASNSFPTILAAILTAASASAGEMYRFAIDRDGLTGAPACKLNSPIGPQDRIHVRDGHFYTVGEDGVPNSRDDRRVRLWGINLSAPLSFPRTMAEAERLAARLDTLGFNAVRLHSFDGAKDGPDYMTVIDTTARYPVLNETNMQCLDRLLKALGNHGIYAHFALHVSYTFDTRDCYTDSSGEHRVPDQAKTTERYPQALPMPRGSVPLLMFNREMIELQKRFATAILTRKNHLTGVQYAADPVVASLELNNEASLIETFHVRTEEHPPLYAEELDELWRKWLQAKYATDKSLSRAWQFESGAAKAPGLVNGGFDEPLGSSPSGWTLQKIMDVWPVGDVRKRKVDDWGKYQVNERRELEVTVSKVPPTYWHIFVAQRGIALSEGQVYRIRFKAWADSPRKIQVSCQGGPNLSRQAFPKQRVAITTAPELHEVTFTSVLSDDNCRLNLLPLTSDHPFDPGDNAGRVWFDDVSITWVKPEGLRPDESLESYVARPAADARSQDLFNSARRKDYLRFLSDLEREYYRELKTHLREVVGARQPVTGSQANYGGLLGHKQMAELMGFVDTHCYYDHCTFPPAPHQAEWSYTNVPMVEDPSRSVVSTIVGTHTDAMPSTITEYGPNPFNQYMVESYAIVPAYAAFQDMDAIFVFQYFRGYKDYRDNVDPDRLMSVHNVLGDTRAEVLMSLAATLFRREDVRPARNLVRIPISDQQSFEQVYRGWNTRSLQTWLEDPEEVQDETGMSFDTRMGLISRIRLQHMDGKVKECFPSLPKAGKDPLTNEERTVYVSDTGELTWACYAKGRHSYFTLDTDRAKVVVGYMTREIQLDGVRIAGAGDDDQFGIVSIVSLDGNPVSTSSDLFITCLGGSGKSRNLNVVEVDPVGKRYRLMGPNGLPFYHEEAGPFEIESNPVAISLSSTSSYLSIERLGANGAPRSQDRVVNRGDRFRFTVGRTVDKTPWYRVTVPQNR